MAARFRAGMEEGRAQPTLWLRDGYAPARSRRFMTQPGADGGGPGLRGQSARSCRAKAPSRPRRGIRPVPLPGRGLPAATRRHRGSTCRATSRACGPHGSSRASFRAATMPHQDRAPIGTTHPAGQGNRERPNRLCAAIAPEEAVRRVRQRRGIAENHTVVRQGSFARRLGERTGLPRIWGIQSARPAGGGPRRGCRRGRDSVRVWRGGRGGEAGGEGLGCEVQLGGDQGVRPALADQVPDGPLVPQRRAGAGRRPRCRGAGPRRAARWGAVRRRRRAGSPGPGRPSGCSAGRIRRRRPGRAERWALGVS